MPHTADMPMDQRTLTALRWVSDDYRCLTDSARPDELAAPSNGTRWTNAQLLFHMWFGQRIALAFIILFAVLGRLPRPISIGFARLLTALTVPYNWINYAAPLGGARLVGLQRSQRWMSADTYRLLHWAATATDTQLRLRAAVPPDWDPYFQPWMTRADILNWAPQHYRHHRAQLTLSTMPDAPEP